MHYGLSFRHKLFLLLTLLLVVNSIGLFALQQQRKDEVLNKRFGNLLLRHKINFLEMLRKQDNLLKERAEGLAAHADIKKLIARKKTERLADYAKNLDFLALLDAEGAPLDEAGDTAKKVYAQYNKTLLQTARRDGSALTVIDTGEELIRLILAPVKKAESTIAFIAAGKKITWRITAFSGMAQNDQYGILLYEGGRRMILQGFSGQTETLDIISRRLASQQFKEKSAVTNFAGKRFAYLLIPGQTGKRPLCFLALSLGPVEFFEFMDSSTGLFLLLCWIFGLWGAHHFTRHMETRLDDVKTALSQVERENYDYRLDVFKGETEFDPLIETFNDMLENLEEQARLCNAMRHIVSKQLAYEILQNSGRVQGECTKAAALISNIRGFSEFSNTFKPRELLAFLNNYFTRMNYCVDGRGGLINTYLGDTMLALFGVPVLHNDDYSSAAEAALDMLEALELFNLEVAANKEVTVDIGIGIYGGPLIAGNIGAEDRLTYSVIGESIKLAMRLQDLSRGYGVSIVVSHDIYQTLHELQPRILCRKLDTVHLGRAGSHRIYEVLPRRQYSAQREEWLQGFQQAQTWLEDGDYPKAYRLFQELHTTWRADKPTQLLLRRCEYMMKARDLAVGGNTRLPAGQ